MWLHIFILNRHCAHTLDIGPVFLFITETGMHGNIYFYVIFIYDMEKCIVLTGFFIYIYCNHFLYGYCSMTC